MKVAAAGDESLSRPPDPQLDPSANQLPPPQPRLLSASRISRHTCVAGAHDIGNADVDDAHEAQLLRINPSASARVYFLTYRGPPVFDGLALDVTQRKSTRLLIIADCNGAAALCFICAALGEIERKVLHK